MQEIVDHEPFVTVLMPVFNAAAYLPAAINSILRQTYTRFELLIVDDGSTDDTAQVITSFHDPRIRYHYKEHSGLGDSLNYGLELSRYDIVARMDGDDISLPTRLEEQVALFTTLPKNTIVATQYALFEGDTITGVVKCKKKSAEIKERLALHNELTHSAVMFDRNFIKSVGGYNTGIFEDFELWLRCKNKAEFVIIPQILSLVRYRTDSYSRADLQLKNSMVLTLLESYGSTEKEIFEQFHLASMKEAQKVKAWRTYFYGERKNARKSMLALFFQGIFSMQFVVAFIFTLLPDTLFIMQKEMRIRFRLKKYLLYFSNEIQMINKILREIQVAGK